MVAGGSAIKYNLHLLWLISCRHAGTVYDSFPTQIPMIVDFYIILFRDKLNTICQKSSRHLSFYDTHVCQCATDDIIIIISRRFDLFQRVIAKSQWIVAISAFVAGQ